MKLTKEMLALLQTADSADTVLRYADENGITITKEQADSLFQNYHGKKEIDEEELASVSGGCPDTYKRNEEDDYYPPVIEETTHFIPEE